MKPWVKSLIKTKQTGYLTLRTNEGLRIIPYTYSYQKGRLISIFSILQADILFMMEKFPSHHILIVDQKRKIGLTGRFNLDKSNLNQNWMEYVRTKYDLPSSDKIELERVQIPHLNKSITVEFIPRKIEIEDGSDAEVYEMEILS